MKIPSSLTNGKGKKVAKLCACGFLAFSAVSSMSMSVSAKEAKPYEYNVASETERSGRNIFLDNQNNLLARTQQESFDTSETGADVPITKAENEVSKASVAPSINFDSSQYAVHDGKILFYGLVVTDEDSAYEDMTFDASCDFDLRFADASALGGGIRFAFEIGEDFNETVYVSDEAGNQASLNIQINYEEFIRKAEAEGGRIPESLFNTGEGVLDGHDVLSFQVKNADGSTGATSSGVCIYPSTSKILNENGYFWSTIGDYTISELNHAPFKSSCNVSVHSNGTYYLYIKDCDNNIYMSSVVIDNIEEGLEKETTFTVHFYDFKGKLIESVEVKKGESAIAPVPPEREGYSFLSWSNSFDNVQKNMSVYARYVNNPLAGYNTNSGQYATNDILNRLDAIEKEVLAKEKRTESEQESCDREIVEEKDFELVTDAPCHVLEEASASALLLSVSEEDYMVKMEKVSDNQMLGSDIAMSIWEEESKVEETNASNIQDESTTKHTSQNIGLLVILILAGGLAFYILNKKYYWIYLPF